MGAPETLPAARVRSVHLGNGLKILVQEIHTAPLVSVWCWYGVGSGDETPGLTGVSHWVEHMNFKGTEHIPRDEMKGIVEKFGGTWNGYTWIDQTTYLETAGQDALDTLLFIEAERMAYGLYEQNECESERTVIISELQGGDNDPDQLLDTEVTASAFRAHPYRHPTIGWIEDLRAMTREDLFGHYRRHYVPGNATLVVVGAVDTDEVLKRAEAHFGRIPSSPVPARRRPAEPAQRGERRVVVEREGTTAYLKFAWHAPSVMDPDFFPMLVLDAALSGAKGLNLWTSFRGSPPQRRARLYTSLVERGLASSVAGALIATRDPFLYNVSLTAMNGVTLEALEEAATEAIEDVRVNGLTEEEVARAKRQLRARMVFENDSVTNVAHQLGYFETVAGPGFFDELTSRVQSVTPGQVHEASRRLLTNEGRTVGWFRPLRERA
ncbi:MAG TPA: pitrilysin family protein [Vicinamibacterales bacterium]